MTSDPPLQSAIVLLENEAATRTLGAAFADAAAAAFVESGIAPIVHFSGDLGAGKTTLVRALLRALGIAGRIKSPTYALVEPYEISLREFRPALQHSQLYAPQNFSNSLESGENLSLYLHLSCYHFDFYRFSDASEWLEAGFREYFDGRSLVLVEWPEKAGAALPRPDLHVRLSANSDEDSRTAALDAYSDRGVACLSAAVLSGRA